MLVTFLLFLLHVSKIGVHLSYKLINTVKIMKTSETKELTMELYQSPKKEQNNETYGEFGSECICCGKPMAKGRCLWVHMNENWVAVHPSIPSDYNLECKTLTGANSQGWFPIGSECAKKMKGFTFEAELDKSHPKYK